MSLRRALGKFPVWVARELAGRRLGWNKNLADDAKPFKNFSFHSPIVRTKHTHATHSRTTFIRFRISDTELNWLCLSTVRASFFPFPTPFSRLYLQISSAFGLNYSASEWLLGFVLGICVINQNGIKSTWRRFGTRF